jgi:hypothetical protein
MAGELPRPGVEVLQTFKTASPSFTRPTLVPCAVGPAFEVINVLSSDGTLNSKAKYGSYAQFGSAITESSFPDPRNNIDELNVLEESVRPFMLSGGTLTELLTDPGSAFLATSHGAGKAALTSEVPSGFGTGLALQGKVLVLAIDQPARLSTVKDVTVTFSGSSALTAEQCASQINLAVGQTVAFVVGTGLTKQVRIVSPTFGAMSSVTVRAGGSANTLLQLGYNNGSAAHEERVEGSGFCGEDQNDNTTKTPWIKFRQGSYMVDGSTIATAQTKAGLVNIETNTFVADSWGSVTFGSSGTYDLRVGDFFYADGLRPGGAEVSKVEASRFKLGTINAAQSIADSSGKYISKVYDTLQVGTLYDANPLAPSFAYFKANDINWKRVAPTAAVLTGAVPASAAIAGSLSGSVGNSGPYLVAGLTLHYVSTIEGVDYEGVFTFTGGPYSDDAGLPGAGLLTAIDKVAALLNGHIPGVSVASSTPGVGNGVLKFVCSIAGRLDSITIKKDGTANAALGFSTSSDTTSSNQADASFTGLTGKSMSFKLDSNPHIYSVGFSSNSIDLAVTEINHALGAVVASKSSSATPSLVLTSTLKGSASKLEVLQTNPTGAEVTFGFVAGSNTVSSTGSGRPLPDAYLDDASVLHIQSQVVRDLVTGYPLDPKFNTATLYIQFKALRLDVTAVAKVAGVLRISDIPTLSAVLDPLTEDNPLGLAAFLMMINAPTFEVKLLGVDEVTAAAPMGTGPAYARAASLLEAEEVYALAPLTQDEVIHSLWVTHATVMSEPEQGGERIVFFNKKMPTRKNPTVALSGTQGNSTTTVNQMLLDGNPAPGLVAAGVNSSLPIPESAEVYLEFEVGGELRRYSVSSITGAMVNLRTSFSSTVNSEGFYSTTGLTEVVVNASYSLKVRGASLTVPGSNPPRPDYSLLSTTVSDANAGYGNRRAYSVFPDTVKTIISGIEKSIPGYYACACIAGMVAAKPPQQGFTNYPMTGLTGVAGTEKFSKKQLNVIAGGGTYILAQDASDGPVFSRHQLSTDTSSIETRELSITKVVDFTAKFLRLSIRKFIGSNNINDGLMDALGTTISAVLKFLESSGVLSGANLNNIVQDSVNKDTVLIDVTLDVPYPCNYIRLTLAV